MRPAGHILGAASVVLELDHPHPRTIVFSGDLGRPRHPLLASARIAAAADVIVVESTYGDRRHDDEASLALFEQAIARTIARRGIVIIPSFAVDRTEVVLFHLNRLMRERRVPRDADLCRQPDGAGSVQALSRRGRAWDEEIRPEVAARPEVFDPASVTEVRTVEESMALNALAGPAIIISASGMATGGRVLHHLAHRLPDPANTVILVGYQADGTRGRRLLDGERAAQDARSLRSGARRDRQRAGVLGACRSAGNRRMAADGPAPAQGRLRGARRSARGRGVARGYRRGAGMERRRGAGSFRQCGSDAE